MNDMLSILSNKIETNNLTDLKKYIQETDNEIKNNSNSIQYSYNLNINLYKKDTEDGIVKVNPSTVLESIGIQTTASSSSIMSQSVGMVSQMDVWTTLFYIVLYIIIHSTAL